MKQLMVVKELSSSIVSAESYPKQLERVLTSVFPLFKFKFFVGSDFQYPFKYDIRTTPREISTETGTKDLQTVGISLRVLTHPDLEHLPKIHREVGPDFRDRVLPSLGNEIMKAVVAQYNAEQLLTEREKVSQRISELLEERAEKYHIKLDDVSITHLAFGKDFNNAIEQKQVALQRAEKAKFVVARAEQEKIVRLV